MLSSTQALHARSTAAWTSTAECEPLDAPLGDAPLSDADLLPHEQDLHILTDAELAGKARCKELLLAVQTCRPVKRPRKSSQS